MKSQDILILLKLVCLKQQLIDEELREQSSVRALEAALGVSKTEVNASINRSIEAGLAIKDRKIGYPKPNVNALLEFLIHGIKYVFPVKPAEIVRGLPTAFDAVVLKGELKSAGGIKCVWSDPNGKEQGQAIQPLFRSAPEAAKQDQQLYHYLALVDAIRIGKPREATLAKQLLKELINT